MNSNVTTNATTCVVNVTYTTWTDAPAPLSPKEARQRQRAKEWLAKTRLIAEAHMAKEMAIIEARAKANEWRPRISHNQSNPFQMSWWTLGRYDDDDEPRSRLYRCRWDKGWVGLTVNDISDRIEEPTIRAFLKTIRARDLLQDWESWEDSAPDVGSHNTMSLNAWFRNLDDHNRFVAMLESIPSRTQIFYLGDAADAKAIKHLLKDENHAFTKGSSGIALTMAEGTNAVLVKMFVG